ncbi:MAG: hypothetical protein A7316_06430 [Candidatus Altiarchaeales archaeon WOR_SM1_86-2]|nr:MAG: hypothetical protein A7316_06430 [Candidatus Altiarchaeales archaeon WOR_SM1_86-2]ODS39617.1 MAG: hypothetical protein A7315_10750 [Candidatus Altiarchaeales archaeon WOR_SM1_79]
MATITLAVPDELKHRMVSFPEINWSEVARQSFMQKIEDLEFLRKFKSKSTLTEEEALKLGDDLSKKLAGRYVSDEK